jgi:peptide subunit release factor 1 (eRF1)
MPISLDDIYTDAIGAQAEQLLDQLAEFEPTTFPVLSLYLNMQRDQHGRVPDPRPYLEREFKSLARSWQPGAPERESFDRDTERILAFLDARLDPATSGLALFACSAKDLFESIEMKAPIAEHRIYVYNQPHLYQLALVDDENPRYAAAVTDANRARIFVFGLGGTLDFERVSGKKMHRVKVGGWSQARYQRRVENAQQSHAKEVAEQLVRIAREDRVTKIFVMGDSETVPLLLQELPQDVREMVVEGPKLGRDAPEADVFTATMEKMQEEDAKSDAGKVERLLEAYRGRGLAVVGPEAVLEALTNGQVDELLLSALLEKTNEEPVAVDAIVAPEIPDSAGGTASEEPREVSLPDLLVTKARQTSARIAFIQDSTALESVGGVGAFLRWRNQ